MKFESTRKKKIAFFCTFFCRFQIPELLNGRSTSYFSFLFQLLESKSVWSDSLSAEIPRHWERHGDLALLPSSAFAASEEQVWRMVGVELWETVCQCLKVEEAEEARSV